MTADRDRPPARRLLSPDEEAEMEALWRAMREAIYAEVLNEEAMEERANAALH